MSEYDLIHDRITPKLTSYNKGPETEGPFSLCHFNKTANGYRTNYMDFVNVRVITSFCCSLVSELKRTA